MENQPTKDANKDSKRNIKEGDASQARPEHGSKGGTNTSSREDQLPLGGNENLEEQKKGSDADGDNGGKPSI